MFCPSFSQKGEFVKVQNNDCLTITFCIGTTSARGSYKNVAPLELG